MPSLTDVIVCEDPARRKLKAIKPNKSAGLDDIPTKLLKLPEPALSLPRLVYSRSVLTSEKLKRPMLLIKKPHIGSLNSVTIGEDWNE